MHLHLDGISGVSGDMLLAALSELAGTTEPIERVASSCFGPDVSISVSDVQRAGNRGRLIDINEKEATHPLHGLSEALECIERCDVPETVKERSRSAITALAEAESRIHGVPIEDMHFHEINGVDTIVDIVGVFALLEHLKITSYSMSPLNVGSGTVEIAHGEVSVPAPATAELVSSLPICSAGPATELTTPTGACLVRTLAPEPVALPSGTLQKIGYGAGQKDFPSWSNVLRLFLYEQTATQSVSDTIVELSANIDDTTPELLGALMDALFDAKALDVTFSPIFMKKQRPGTRVDVLCHTETQQSLIDVLFNHSTTFGVRSSMLHREKLEVSFIEVETPFGTVRVKQGTRNGTLTTQSPEFDSCQHAAEASSVPVQTVYRAAIRALELPSE